MPGNTSAEIVAGSGAADFATRVDNWLLAVLVFALIMSTGAVLVTATRDPRSAAVAGAVEIGAIALVVALSVPTRYTIGDRELVIRSGMLRYRIPLEAIRRVYPTRNPLSAPAWSLDRLGIEFERKRGRSLALISPDRRDEFLDLLAERAGLERRGKELRREWP